ncbi:MAG: prolipoprotein diacylglyceryl transferase, partial [Candidatus Peregrinibacteria bacterium]|nr:prolipoprotein diacylglyceryl transferase [Candidatus Peregrinibacteria bacterium]
MNFSQLGLGFFSLKIYGILVAIAFVLAVLKFFGVVRKNNFDLDFFIHHFWRWVVSGIILGRIFILILYPEIFSRNGIFSFFAFWDGEVHFLGSLLGFLLVAYFDLRAHDKSFFKWLDAGIPSILVGVFIVDIAGFFTGAVYGNETSLFWGVQYETSGVDILNPVHPVTIYAAILHFLIFRWTKLYQKAFSRIPGKL